MNLIAKDVYQISLMPRNAINCYVIEDVLIDSGIRSSAARILGKLNGYKINSHAITHAHADHQGSSKEICEELKIPFLCHHKEKDRAEQGTVVDEYPNPNNLISKFQMKYWAGLGYKVSGTLQDGDQIGGFTVIETPGHSSGHISFYRESDGVLIIGDVLTNMNLLTTIKGINEPPKIFTSDAKQSRESLIKLCALKPKIICFGHGPVLFEGRELQSFVHKNFK